MSGRITVMLALSFFACNGTTPIPRDVLPENAPGSPPPVSTAGEEEELAPPVDGPTLMPVDDASTQPGLEEFRDRLVEYAEAGNIDAIVAAAGPEIRTSFGGGGGREDFRELLNEPGMLDEFRTILELGGTMRGEAANRSYWAPYVYSEWPDDVDAFTHAAVIEDRVPLLENRDARSPAVATLSYDIVQLAQPSAQYEGWRRVTTSDGRAGWVEERHLRSPIDYRTALVRGENGWAITLFIAGD